MATSSTLTPQQQLFTTQHFCNALLRHIDISKPDPLVINQILNLKFQWEQTNQLNIGPDAMAAGVVVDDILQNANTENFREGNLATSSIIGTLNIFSEYTSIAIHVICKWRITVDESSDKVSSSCPPSVEAGTNYAESDAILRRSSFQNVFYFRLAVSASLISLKDYNKHIGDTATATCTNHRANNEQNETRASGTLDRIDKSTHRKLRAGILKRLESDPFIRRLLIDDDNDASLAAGGVLLCEALIQQNQKRSNQGTDEGTGVTAECEERVNVDSESVEGVRNAILAHCEDNLDVLELLLNMPYLPRGKFLPGGHECENGPTSDTRLNKERKALKALSERAFLRILEDAMWDACEKEGEDEMLDDLVLSENGESDHNSDVLQLQVNKKIKS